MRTAVAQLTVKINGYAYTVGCDDGQERHLMQMASEVETRIDSIKALGGQSGESRLLVLASLLMADELHDQKKLLANLQSELSRLPQAEADSRRRLARLADRAEEIAQGLEQT
jgi:cell division protein ZapA